MYELAKVNHHNPKLLYLNRFETTQDFFLSRNLKLVESLLNGKLVLIAYDCDANFEPCFKNGKKAHWALIHGFSYSFVDGALVENEASLTSTKIKSNCFKLVENDGFEHCLDRIDFEKFHVFAKQGKSKHSAIWSLKQLLLSNAQLNEVDDKCLNPDEFILPTSGISETLASKYLLIE